MQVKAIIFDLYGVLGINSWQSFKKQHFADRPEAWEPLRRLGQSVDAGETDESEFVAALAEATGELEATVRAQFENTKANHELLDFISNYLKPHYKVGLLSNASKDVTKHIFSDDERQLFDEIVLSAQHGYTKPDRDAYQLICDRLELSPSECLMIDDQPKYVEAAKKHGLPTLLFSTNQQIMAELKDYLRL